MQFFFLGSNLVWSHEVTEDLDNVVACAYNKSLSQFAFDIQDALIILKHNGTDDSPTFEKLPLIRQ